MLINGMSISDKISEFCTMAGQSLDSGSFIKLSLGNYKGADETLKKIYVKKILVKREVKLSFTYHHKTRDIVKNYDEQEGIRHIRDALGNGFHMATLFTTDFDLNYESFNNKAVLKKLKPTSKEIVSLVHDRNKNRLIGNDKSYLTDLKITDDKGNVYKNAQDKYRQINKYIEILDPLLKAIPDSKVLNIADMGSGKGYLTFALYDYIHQTLQRQANIVGVEYRQDMVDLCNEIAKKSEFSGLRFVQGGIGDYEDKNLNVLIALHACDTATDDAIYKGIKAEADLIVVAPCCHKQIRRQIESHKPDNDLDFLTRHGIFMERHAEMVTDGIRALILEYFGYTVKVFEFISDAHTAKNVMITAIKNSKSSVKKNEVLSKIHEAKSYLGIEQHYLEELAGL